MPMKLNGLEAAITSLSAASSRMTQAAVDELKAGADAIEKRAISYAPVDTGDLESDIKAQPMTSSFAKSEIIIAVEPGLSEAYAEVMHESSYNLGPKSAAKAAASGALVGPKFLSRAANELFPRIKAAISAALKRSQ